MAGTDACSRRQMRIPLLSDPLHLVAALADANLFDRYLAYEAAGRWYFAGGVHTRVRVMRGVVETCTDTGTRRRARGAGLSVLSAELAALPLREWRAFGWAAFELGAPDGEPDGVLLELTVPEVEVRIRGREAVLLGFEHRRMSAAAEFLAGRRPWDDSGSDSVDLRLDDDGGYRSRVAATVEAIRSGQLSKAIVSRAVPVPVPIDLPATLVRGRSANTPARSFLLRTEDFGAVGFSPETVVEVSADGRVATTPLAGTRALLGSGSDDAFLRGELLADPKEVYEHAISVKAAVREMSAVCDDVSVEEFMAIALRGSVQHLASRVTGWLGPGRDYWHAFAMLFPAITASGIPKDDARRLISSLEPAPRGLYAGAIITCDIRGELDAALVLRSAFQQDGRTWVQAGAGIVADSRPDREFEETCEKLRSIAPYLVPAAVHDPA